MISIDVGAFCIYSLPMITWDETKRRKNIREHKIDLVELESVFDRHMVTVEDDREAEWACDLLGLDSAR